VHYGDIVKGLPIAPESCAAIYCSHILEHLALDQLRRALVNTCGYLKHGGVFRCVLPDLERLVSDYSSSQEELRAMRFMEQSHLGYQSRPSGIPGFVREWLGNSRHLWMWDYHSLVVELKTAGFAMIRRAHFGDSDFACFEAIEDNERWENGLGIECRKA